MLFDYNEIEKVVKKQTENIFIVYTLKDLKSPLEMLDVSGYYNKNE